MKKYEPLQHHLEQMESEQIPMSFRDIERIIGDTLPASARRHRAWWSNNPTNSVITYAWLAAGYRSEQVDLEAEALVFRRIVDQESSPSAGEGSPSSALFGCMKGLLTIAAGVDIAAPLEEDWKEPFLGLESAGP